MTEDGRRARNEQYELILNEEFELMYYMRGGISYSDVEGMTGLDRKKFHRMLVDHLKEHPPTIFG